MLVIFSPPGVILVIFHQIFLKLLVHGQRPGQFNDLCDSFLNAFVQSSQSAPQILWLVAKILTFHGRAGFLSFGTVISNAPGQRLRHLLF